jgi:RNA recognition motif-containing protein
MNQRLYIGNLSPGVTENDLQLLFSKAGNVAEVKLMLDPATGQSRGYAFVTMGTPDSAAAALRDFHSTSLGGRYITVTEARAPQEPKGMMSEGFGFADSTPFASHPPAKKAHRAAAASGFRRRRRSRR